MSISAEERVEELIALLGNGVERDVYQDNLRMAIERLEAALEASLDDDRRETAKGGEE